MPAQNQNQPLSARDLLGAVALISSRQHGLISRRQLRDLGLSDSRIDSWARSGKILRVASGVFHMTGSPYTWHTRVLAACLANGGVASHRSAAALWGFRDMNRGRPEVSVPRNARARDASGRIHHPKDFELIRPTWIDDVPTTDAARVLIDMAAVVDAKALESMAYQFVNRRLGDWKDLLREHVRHARRGKPGTAAMRAVIDAHYGGATESALEDRLLHIVRDAGLPEPVKQFRIMDGPIELMRGDLAWPPHQVDAEADSEEFHLNPTSHTEDKIKRANARRIGWAVQEYTHEMMKHRVVWLCEDLSAVLRSRGARW
ncbi:MAG: type IV toxin-antitoxin system AbiEi family antitoxin domain-containing protein [Actinobacteria bacterium]|nr:type IV toxin-antitoxin system AbiEi family antitoxin domain-containing protein [Actinomycetota bacterium]